MENQHQQKKDRGRDRGRRGKKRKMKRRGKRKKTVPEDGLETRWVATAGGSSWVQASVVNHSLSKPTHGLKLQHRMAVPELEVGEERKNTADPWMLLHFCTRKDFRDFSYLSSL